MVSLRNITVATGLRPPDMDVDDRGNIYVVDYSNTRIQKYDPLGRYLNSCGRRGQGPGEIQMPNCIKWDTQGILWVFDSTRKIIGFYQDGTLAKILKVEIPGLSELHLFQEGFIFASTGTINTEAGPRKRIIKIKPGESQQEIIHEFTLPGSGNRTQRASHYYQNGLTLISLDGSSFCFGYSAEYRIYKCDGKGKTVLIIENKEAPTSISGKEKAETLEKGISSWSGSQRPENLDFPPHHPYFRQILADSQGRIYVERLPSILEASPLWKLDVYGKNGSFLCRVELPVRPHLST